MHNTSVFLNTIRRANYQRLGNSGFRVSVPILGGMSIGSSAWASWLPDEENSIALLKAAYERGVTTWDTANIYSNGVSESILGKAIYELKIPRSKIQLLTKCGGAVAEEVEFRSHENEHVIKHSRDYVNKYGLSRSAILDSVETSLERLQTQYIDLLQIHHFDPATPIEETMETLHDLVKSSKVRYIGACSMWAYQFARMQFTAESRRWTKFISMQNNYSLLYREEEREMIPFCQATGVGLIPYKPLASGALARPLSKYGQTPRSSGWDLAPEDAYNTPQREIIARVETVAKSRGWTMSQVALSWVHQSTASYIVGLSSVAQLVSVLDMQHKQLTKQESQYLSEPYITMQVQGHK